MAQGGAISTAEKRVFEEYRYDALNRRVWVRTSRDCNQQVSQNEKMECQTSTLRRTIWDGNQEFVEIQVPSGDTIPVSTLENDDYWGTAHHTYGGSGGNMMFGRVVYVHGLGGDYPIGVTRYRYVDDYQNTFTIFPPMTWSVFWTPLNQLGFAVCGDGRFNCSYGNASMGLDFKSAHFAYDRVPISHRAFQGTLVVDKEDATRTLYRRNRVYDPSTGRFTQEDPIGLAGGVNLYGFAAADPVNYSDPLGLCPPDKPLCQWIKAALIAAGTDIGGVAGGGTGILGGPFAEVTVPAGAYAGMALGGAIGGLVGEAVDNVFFSQSGSGSSQNQSNNQPQYKQPASGKSAAEAAKDVPSWAKGNRPLVGENGKTFAKRLLDNKYGAGKWEGTGPGSEFSKIKKWGDRGFIDPQ